MASHSDEFDKIIEFVDLFPTNIGSVSFMSTNQDVQYLVGDATFRFSYYTFNSAT